MYEWRKHVQRIADAIDRHIENRDDDALTLSALAKENGYSEFHMSRKFQEISGLSLREYLRRRRLAFALIDVRDSAEKMLDIALDYGFSSHEAFCRSFKAAYGVAPSAYRANPKPVVLRTKLNTFDRYFLGLGEIGMIKSNQDVKIYFTQIPAHKFLYIKNYDSKGYFDFWEKQKAIPGADCDTTCGLLDSITGKLDGDDGVVGKFSGQIMAQLYENGKTAESYGIRLPSDWQGEVPSPLLLRDVPTGDYIVFEHGAFDYEQESTTVGEKLKTAMDTFDYGETDYTLDESPGRISYFYFDPEKWEKRVVPVKLR